MSSIDPDLVAGEVLTRFRALQSRRKPKVRDNGAHEWVPLSGIVAEHDGQLECLAVAIGMKCLPTSKVPQANGTALHDWHAEILALRTANYFLLAECRRLAESPEATSLLLRRRSDAELTCSGPQAEREVAWQAQPFAIRDGVILHMYCSEAPCGDASMELTMAAQDDAAPWELPSTKQTNASEEPAADGTLLGRGYFSQLGVVRRKPARADAPPTMSKSCSDKMALKQCSSILSSLVSLFIHPGNAYISSVVIPDYQYSVTACERSFSPAGRMSCLAGRTWDGGFAYRPFEVRTTKMDFEFSRRSVQARSGKIATCNLAAAWNSHGLDEGLVNGVLQGRKASDPKGGSLCSRRKMWSLAREAAALIQSPVIQAHLSPNQYCAFKAGTCLAPRSKAIQEAKVQALAGWAPNIGDDTFTIEPLT
ncbi:adenosine-deaminase [Plectosphaerella plurivora]|uniref:Adenosine-deaminase n=1 Tax=Plectosphaerella plurivora TaxID=936078 RepID=A0A9P8VMB6_9PEZI|nr:adenosine-deaminase [Plectosphaerella plurivora]